MLKKIQKNSIKIFKKIESGLFDLGLYSEVEKFYRKIIKINPSNIEAAVRLANVLEEKGENESALALIDSFKDLGKFNLKRDLMKIKLSLLNSTPIELSQQIDSLILNMENENKFLSLIIFVPLAIFPQNIEMYLSLIDQGQIEGVKEQLPALISKYPNNPDILFLAGVLSMDGNKSYNIYKELLENFPDSKYAPDAAVKIGEYYYSLGFIRKLEPNYLKFLEFIQITLILKELQN